MTGHTLLTYITALSIATLGINADWTSNWSGYNLRGHSNGIHRCFPGEYVQTINWRYQKAYGYVDLMITCTDGNLYIFTGNRHGAWDRNLNCKDGFQQVIGRYQTWYGMVNATVFCKGSSEPMVSGWNPRGKDDPVLHCPPQQRIVGFETQEQSRYGIINFRIICN